MKRVELNKLKMDIYDLILGPHTIPPMSQKLSKKRMRLKYSTSVVVARMVICRCRALWLESNAQQFLILWLFHQLSKLLFPNKYCGYSGTVQELIVNYIHPLFLDSRSAASREENPNWLEVTTVVSYDNYWKAMKVNISTLESMGTWDIVD